MHLLPPGLLWILLAVAGTSTAPVESPARTAALDVAVRGEPRPSSLFPLRRSLERFHELLSEGCWDLEPQGGTLQGAPDDSGRTHPSDRRPSCLAAAQVTTAPPPPLQSNSTVYLVGLLAITLIGWLISKL
jgi:hypothetical protein